MPRYSSRFYLKSYCNKNWLAKHYKENSVCHLFAKKCFLKIYTILTRKKDFKNIQYLIEKVKAEKVKF